MRRESLDSRLQGLLLGFINTYFLPQGKLVHTLTKFDMINELKGAEYSRVVKRKFTYLVSKPGILLRR